MNDPSASDAFLRALAYGHPVWMTIALAVAALAARSGLAMRRARLLRTPRAPDDRRRHLRIAKLAVALVVIGACGGPLSIVWLRGRAPFETAHGLAGALALGLFITAGLLGRVLERGRGRPLDAHALCGVLALLASGVAAVTGFVLLP